VVLSLGYFIRLMGTSNWTIPAPWIFIWSLYQSPQEIRDASYFPMNQLLHVHKSKLLINQKLNAPTKTEILICLKFFFWKKNVNSYLSFLFSKIKTGNYDNFTLRGIEDFFEYTDVDKIHALTFQNFISYRQQII
jgi:hypothetical protein